MLFVTPSRFIHINVFVTHR